MKDYHVPIILIIVMSITSLFIVGCSTYKEGDEVASNSFKKMTVQEKTMYDAVEKEWYQDTLVAIRTSVGKRDIAPRENSIPFIDIANVIKTNNDVTLKLNEAGWSTDHKNRAIKCRWDRLDEEWYKKLLLTIGITNYTVQELIPEEVVEEEPKTQKEKDIEYIGNGLKEINKLLDERSEVVKVNTKDIVPESKYDDIFYDIRKCDEAIIMYQQIIEERLLTWNDYDLLMRISTKCKAIQIGEKLTEWKN